MAWFRNSNGALMERLERVEREMKSLRLEADDLFQKTRRAMWRALKTPKDPESLPSEDPPGMPPGLDPVSAAMWRRRLASKAPRSTNGGGEES